MTTLLASRPADPPAQATPSRPPPSSRAVLAQWVRAQIAGKDEVDIPQLAKATLNHFRPNATFIDALVDEVFPDMVYEMVRSVLASTRLIEAGDVMIAPAKLKARAASRWDRWLEHTGEHHVRLMEMNRPQLLAAANERKDRGMHEMRLSKLFRKLAGSVGVGQVVKDVFSPEEIEALHAAINKP